MCGLILPLSWSEQRTNNDLFCLCCPAASARHTTSTECCLPFRKVTTAAHHFFLFVCCGDWPCCFLRSRCASTLFIATLAYAQEKGSSSCCCALWFAGQKVIKVSYIQSGDQNKTAHLKPEFACARQCSFLYLWVWLQQIDVKDLMAAV